jgi:hypothetical protein
MTRITTNALAFAALFSVGLATPVLADNWDMYLTVDNQFDVYFGTATTTTGNVVGSGNDWQQEYHFTANGQLPTDYLYVATASDHKSAQGFIGVFTNTTTNATVTTGDVAWEVFAAGAHAATNPYWPNAWPSLQMPTQAQVDTAIAYAETNGLWVNPVGAAGYDNDPATPIAPYGMEWGTTYPNMPRTAQWVWHDSGSGDPPHNLWWPRPLHGYNHDEFLVFRVVGAAPAPGTAALLGLAGLTCGRRRR